MSNENRELLSGKFFDNDKGIDNLDHENLSIHADSEDNLLKLTESEEAKRQVHCIEISINADSERV